MYSFLCVQPISHRWHILLEMEIMSQVSKIFLFLHEPSWEQTTPNGANSKLTNFDFCPLFAWMSNIGDPLFLVDSVVWSLVFVWSDFWILQTRTFQFEFPPVEQGILPMERPCTSTLVATGKISESAAFLFGMSLGHSLLSCVFQFEATV